MSGQSAKVKRRHRKAKKIGNFEAFYADEIKIRKAMLYPPFAQLCLVGFVCDNSVKVSKAAGAFLSLLTESLNREFSDIPIRILGPSASAVPKVNNKYRHKIILKTIYQKIIKADNYHN